MFEKIYNSLEIKRGNKVYYLLMLIFCVLTAVGCHNLKGLDLESSRQYLIKLNIMALVIMIPYRILLVFDREYMDMCYPNTNKSYLFELPLFPCNTAEILFLFALLMKSRLLISYCFFLGFIGPIAAFISPALGFENKSLLHFRIFGFYIVHYICLMNIPLFLWSGLFIPTYMDVLYALGLYTLISLLVYFVNLYLNKMDLGSTANYFFNLDPSYHPLFQKAYDIIPIPFLFTIPLEIGVGIIFCIIVFIINLIV